MKVYYFKTLAVLFLISAFFTACDPEEEIPVDNYRCICTMNTGKSMVSFSLNTRGENANTASIDWGDGQKESLTFYTTDGKTITHSYKTDKQPPHIITVSGPIDFINCEGNQLTSLNITGPVVDLLCRDNQLTSLDLNRLQLLERLYCNGNQLTGLDVNMNTELQYLDIRYNLMDAESLNNLFSMLPNRSSIYTGSGSIYITGNPGADTCDRNIAYSQGWSVDNSMK